MTPSTPTVWWDDDTIEQTVTKDFVRSRLIGDEIARLDEPPLAFGESLTDDTYWDWIRSKAKRIFMILADLNLPDQIFGLIDDSWDDDMLPIAYDQVWRLALTSHKDEKTEKRFYRRQYFYLLHHLQHGEHFDYGDDEVVPLDVVDKKHGSSHSFHPHITKVALPGEPGKAFCRCQVPLGLGGAPGYLTRDQFVEEINGIRPYQNEHLLSYWASYTHQGHGYVLLTPAPEYSLKSLLTTIPSSLKTLSKRTRRQTILDWLHCLADTLCVLHNSRPPSTSANIKPSTVMFTRDHRVLLAGYTPFHARLLAGGVPTPSTFDKEAYDYGAPEQGGARISLPLSLPPAIPTLSPSAATLLAAADTYALGCVSLELISLLFKKHGRAFAAHRAARHRAAGRGGAVPDASFHRNGGQVESWAVMLAAEAGRKEEEEGKMAGRDGNADRDAATVMLRGVAPLLRVVVTRMMNVHPEERPAAVEVQARMYEILGGVCGIREPHCVHHYGGSSGSGSGSGSSSGGGGHVHFEDGGVAGLRPMSSSPARRSGSTGGSGGAPASMSLPIRWMSGGRRGSVPAEPRRPSTSGGSTGSGKSGNSASGQEGRVKANSRGREGKTRDKSKK